MPDKQLSAGDPVESKCTKCRAVMNHTIVAIVDGKPGRVECNTCKGVHNYRKPTEVKPAKKTGSSTTSRKGVTRKVDPDLAAWETLALDEQATNAVPYSMQTLFNSDDIVKHPTFGLGKVLQVLPPNKVEILFKDGRKLLRCG